MVKLSIIIPIYNTAESKLKNCFDSINKIGERLRYESILIDDGSKDSIRKFCEKYCEEKETFRYIRKTNGGASSARNVGIKEARGEYLCFVDSDDTIEADIIIKQFGMRDDADLILTDLRAIRDGKEEIWKALPMSAGDVNTLQVVNELSKHGKLNGPVCKAIRRKFLLEKKIDFDENMILGEDAIFIYDIILNRPQIKYYQKISYNYNINQLTSKNRVLNYTEKVFDNYVLMYTKMLFLIREGEFDDSIKKVFVDNATCKFIQQIFNLLMDLAVYTSSINEYAYLAYKALQKLDSNSDFCTQNCRTFKTKIQFYLMKKESWTMISILSRARKIYIRFK